MVEPGQPGHKLCATGLSDVGRRRAENEDSYLIDGELGLALVADGMGGHGNGGEASSLVVQFVEAFLRSPPQRHETGEPVTEGRGGETPTLDTTQPRTREELVAGAIAGANREIFLRNSERGFGEGQGMGTTVVGLWHDHETEELLIFHVGDSRLFRLRDDDFSQLTRDHTLHQSWIDTGRVGPPPKRSQLLRAMGPLENTTPDVERIELRVGDRFLLCSDGLTDMVSPQEIEEVFKATRSDAQETCRQLVEFANERGGKDNVTVVVAWYE